MKEITLYKSETEIQVATIGENYVTFITAYRMRDTNAEQVIRCSVKIDDLKRIMEELDKP